MARQVFEEQIHDLLEDLVDMGRLVAGAIDRSLHALVSQDAALAQEIIDDDSQVNTAQHEIDEKCLVLIATQQHMARDLRTLMGVSNVAAELERIGDYAEGIAKLVLKIGTEPFIKPLIDVPRMAEESRQMLLDVLEAFLDHDTEAAYRLAARDERIDDLYNQVFRELLVLMMDDPRTITQATYLLWVAHNLERIADRTTNIAERVIFIARGQIEELNR